MLAYTLYIGTYTHNTGSPGIWRLQLADAPADGGPPAATLRPAIPLADPSWVTLSPDGERLYAVEELPAGRVSSFARTAKGWRLTARRSSGGVDPCHLCLCPREGLLFAANYTSGSVAVFQLDEAGALAPGAPAVVRHEGRGFDPVRQQGPHVHFAAAAPGGSVWTLDLGLDALTVYPAKGGGAAPLARLVLPAGFGPRYLAFHPQGHFAYIVGELASAVAVVEVGPNGLPGPCLLQRISTLPSPDGPASWASAVRLSPDGTRLYVANRGQDSVAIFAVQPQGTLRLLAHAASGGAWPRDILPLPDGSALLCANQHSAAGGLTWLPLAADGLPRAPAQPLPSPPAPVCLALAPCCEA